MFDNGKYCKEHQKEWRKTERGKIAIRKSVKKYNSSTKGKKTRKEYMKRHRQELKKEIFSHYGDRCACCNKKKAIEFLTIDHIGGGGNKHRQNIGVYAGTAFYRWLKRNNFPKGYRILCWDCNCSMGAYGYCPHERRK
jgi:hypothetical protein